MPLFRVRWEIDVDAEDQREAAQRALDIQRDPESIATVFEVEKWKDGGDGLGGSFHTIDLLDPEKKAVSRGENNRKRRR